MLCLPVVGLFACRTSYACRLCPSMQVYASGTGNNRHPLFFLQWMCHGSNDRKRKRRASSDLNLPTIKSPIKEALKPGDSLS
jgi:hypothetical protein